MLPELQLETHLKSQLDFSFYYLEPRIFQKNVKQDSLVQSFIQTLP